MVVDTLADDGKQIAANRVFTNLFVVAVLRDRLYTRLQFQIILAGLRAPAEGGVHVFHRVVMATVLFKEGRMQLGEQSSVREAIAQHVQAGLDLRL